MPDVFNLQDRVAVDSAGTEIGQITELYVDADTQEPQWVGISVDGESRVVPLEGASHTEEQLQLAYERDFVISAPQVSVTPLLSTDDYGALVDYFSVVAAAGPPRRWP